jgi:hypothetical protein
MLKIDLASKLVCLPAIRRFTISECRKWCCGGRAIWNPSAVAEPRKDSSDPMKVGMAMTWSIGLDAIVAPSIEKQETSRWACWQKERGNKERKGRKHSNTRDQHRRFFEKGSPC